MRGSLFILLALFFTGCVSQQKVVVDFSPTLRGYFHEYPTIEVDIAAITDAEADEIKQMGVEEYFAPGNGIRGRLETQTVYFYREEIHSFVLPSRAPIWFRWNQKKPTTIIVIASLPHDPSMSASADPRYLTIPISKSVVFARSAYIWVEPKRIVRVSRATSKKGESETTQADQWVEIRR